VENKTALEESGWDIWVWVLCVASTSFRIWCAVIFSHFSTESWDMSEVFPIIILIPNNVISCRGKPKPVGNEEGGSVATFVTSGAVVWLLCGAVTSTGCKEIVVVDNDGAEVGAEDGAKVGISDGEADGEAVVGG